MLDAGPASQRRCDPFQAGSGERHGPGAPAAANPLLAARHDDVGNAPVLVNDTKSLDAVRQQQPIGPDHLTDASQIRAVPGLKINGTDSNGRNIGSELLGQQLGCDKGQACAHDRYLIQAGLLRSQPRIRVGREFSCADKDFPFQTKDELEQPVGDRCFPGPTRSNGKRPHPPARPRREGDRRPYCTLGGVGHQPFNPVAQTLAHWAGKLCFAQDGMLAIVRRIHMGIIGTGPEAFDHPDDGLVGLHVMYQRLLWA